MLASWIHLKLYKFQIWNMHMTRVHQKGIQMGLNRYHRTQKSCSFGRYFRVSCGTPITALCNYSNSCVYCDLTWKVKGAVSVRPLGYILSTTQPCIMSLDYRTHIGYQCKMSHFLIRFHQIKARSVWKLVNRKKDRYVPHPKRYSTAELNFDCDKSDIF